MIWNKGCDTMSNQLKYLINEYKGTISLQFCENDVRKFRDKYYDFLYTLSLFEFITFDEWYEAVDLIDKICATRINNIKARDM